jgi:hypothetical protein
MGNKSRPRGRRQFVTGLLGAGVGIMAGGNARAQTPAQNTNSWKLLYNQRNGLAEAHLDLVIPSSTFSSLDNVKTYTFVLCGQELFAAASPGDVGGNRDLSGNFILEPSSEHEIRVIAATKSGELMRQDHSVAIKADKPQYWVRTLSTRVDPAAQSFVVTLIEVASTFRGFIEDMGRVTATCSVRG